MWVTTIHSISLYTRLVFNSSVHKQLFDFLEKKILRYIWSSALANMAGKIIHNLSRNFSARYNLTNAESLMFGHWLDNKPNIRSKQSQYFDLKTVAVLNCLCINQCSPRYFLNTARNCVILKNFQKKDTDTSERLQNSCQNYQCSLSQVL